MANTGATGLLELLASHVRPLLDGRVGAGAMYEALALWCREAMSRVEPAAVERNGIGFLISQSPSDYLIRIQIDDLRMSLARLLESPPSKGEDVVMCVADLMWCILRCPSGKACPSCAEDVLYYAVSAVESRLDMGSGQVILLCDVCGWAEALSGGAISPPHRALPATKSQLEGARKDDRTQGL